MKLLVNLKKNLKDFLLSLLFFFVAFVSGVVSFLVVENITPFGYVSKSTYIFNEILTIILPLLVVGVVTFLLVKIFKIKIIIVFSAILAFMFLVWLVPNRVRLLTTSLPAHDYVMYGAVNKSELMVYDCLLTLDKDDKSQDYFQFPDGRRIENIRKKYTICYDSSGKQLREEIEYPL